MDNKFKLTSTYKPKSFVRENFTAIERKAQLTERLTDKHCFLIVDSMEDAIKLKNFLGGYLKLPLHTLTLNRNAIQSWDFDLTNLYGFEISKNRRKNNKYAYSYYVSDINSSYIDDFRDIFYFYSKEFHSVIKPVTRKLFKIEPTYNPKQFIREFKDPDESKEPIILHAFDMDDTLVYAKRFEEYIKPMLIKEYLTPEIIFNNKLQDIGVELHKLKYENGRIYFDDPNQEYDIAGKTSWVRKKNRVYIIQPDSFFITDESMPIGKYDEIIDLYDNVDYKCIITARKNRLRKQTIKALEGLGVSKPNMGLFMYAENTFSYTWEYKANKLLEIYTTFNFDEVYYYDNNIKLLKKIKKTLHGKKINIKYFKVTKNRYREI